MYFPIASILVGITAVNAAPVPILGEIISGLVGTVKPVVGGVVSTVSDTLAPVTGAVAGVIEPVNNIVDTSIVGDVTAPVVGAVQPVVAGAVDTVNGLVSLDQITLPGVLAAASETLKPIEEKLKGALSVAEGVNIETVTGLIGEIDVILGRAVVDVQYIVDHPVEAATILAGKVVSVEEVSSSASSLIGSIIPTLSALLATVDGAETATVQPLINQVGAQVSQLINLTSVVTPGVLPTLTNAVSGLTNTISFLGLTDVLEVLDLGL